MKAWLWLVPAILLAVTASARPGDDWQATGTDDITTSSHASDDGKGVCLDFDYHGVSGAASLHRRLSIDFPAHFGVSFAVKGTMRRNDVQLKFTDASGDNVWWYRPSDLRPGPTWRVVQADDRDVAFAWGPTTDKTLRHAASVDLTVYADEGGQGELCLADLRITPIAVQAPRAPRPPTPNAMFEERARHVARGLYPRGFSGEHSYWTLVGVDGDAAHSALLSEDGAVEVDKGGWSIEPMLLDGGHLIDWASGTNTQSLADGYLPMPSVHWQRGGLGLDTTVVAAGTPGRSQLLLRYVVSNHDAAPREVTLALLQRPFQVNPPTQFLNTPGGMSPIHHLAWRAATLTVNQTQRVTSFPAADRFVASRFEQGNLPERLQQGVPASSASVDDDTGYAQGALLYRLQLPAHGQREVRLVLPQGRDDIDTPAAFDARMAQTADAWRGTLNRVTLHLPAAQQAIADTARSALAQILMSRNGPALQPGTRSYARTWVRDGAMMSEGLARSGHADIAADFARWYAPHQFSNGKVPCCVDARGADPVPENDSHGEMIFAIAQAWRYTHDRALLESLWPYVDHAIAYMDRLRASETAPPPFHGLMPASISHEGYSAKPMHSYWDDFWALQGYDDAVMLAQALGRHDDAQRIGASRDAFRADLRRSIETATAQRHIDYLPGAAELGDLDPTSTTIALSPGDGLAWLPPSLLQRTFQRYWDGFVARRDGRLAWNDYTPYELRTIASFVRLGWRDRIGALLDFFFADRRPAAWNQWAEVVGRDPRQPRFVGDMPHAWIASDFLRSAYDLFAYERSSDHALVLAAGLPPAWLKGEGAGIDGLRTPYGVLSYRIGERDGKVTLTIDGGLTVPPGGLVWGDRVIRKVPATVVTTVR